MTSTSIYNDPEKMEQLKQRILRDSLSETTIKQSYQTLPDYLEAIQEHSPTKEEMNYHLSRSIEEIYADPTDFEYKMIIKCYRFRIHFGHSVLTPLGLQEILNFVGQDTVLEPGAGNGYIGHAMSMAGVDIVMTDIPQNPYPSRLYLNRPSWGTIFPMDAVTSIEYFRDRKCLMLIWPPEHSDMAYDAIKMFAGGKLIYIGEARGGHTAKNNFFDELDHAWILCKEVAIPQFMGTSDAMYTYMRA